jgi:hypothetical protein
MNCQPSDYEYGNKRFQKGMILYLFLLLTLQQFPSITTSKNHCVMQKSRCHMFIENMMRKEPDHFEHDNSSGSKHDKASSSGVTMHKSFLEFIEERFISIALPLKDSISISCIHLPISCISEHHLKNLVCLVRNLESFQELLLKNNIDYKVLEVLFSPESKHNSLLRSLTVSLGNCCVLSSYASIDNHFVA